jgi:hypothetical protein
MIRRLQAIASGFGDVASDLTKEATIRSVEAQPSVLLRGLFSHFALHFSADVGEVKTRADLEREDRC